MDKFRIEGGRPLTGEVRISGAKNAALPIILASLLTPEPMVLRNVPDLRDVATCLRLITLLGKCVERPAAGVLRICGALSSSTAPYELVKTMRASIMALGPLTACLGEAHVSLPGGCAIGPRPVDLHVSGLQDMGAQLELSDGYIHSVTPGGRLHGARIVMGKVSVTGTENLMMAAVLAEGTTRIENAAREPEVVDLAECLSAMGAHISGAGTATLLIEGVSGLHGAEHRIVPDRIEAGTYLAAAAATQGCVTCRSICPEALEPILVRLAQANARLERGADWVRLDMRGRVLQPVDIATAPHPGFPTDMQAQFTVLNAMASGPGSVTETIFENRFMHVPELMRMGAELRIQDRTVFSAGSSSLRGAQVMATDLRASASLVIAGLAALGTTVIDRIYHIDRGYERIEDKISGLGGCIERIAG